RSGKSKSEDIKSLQPAAVAILNNGTSLYNIGQGAHPFTDKNYRIKNMAKELQGLKGIKQSIAKQQDDGTVLKFKNDQPVKLVVGFFNSSNRDYVAPSALETNANANNRGQADVRLLNAVGIPGMPPVNIHTYYYGPGENTFKLKHGACLI